MIKNVLKWCIRIVLKFMIPFVKLFKNKKIIILMDRRNAAGDNAEAMYHYLRNRKDCKAYLVLQSDCEDWNRLQPDDHVISISSLKYTCIYLMADVAMYSHKLYYPRLYSVISKYTKLKQVFLQHGVIHEDLSKVYNADCGHDLVCVATRAEYEDRLRAEYGYKPEQICLTGLPRFDCLEGNKKKVITIGLTWRYYLRQMPIEKFKNSTFFRMIEILVIKPELADLTEKYGYEIQMLLHPELDDKYVELIEKRKDRRVEMYSNMPYAEIISNTAILITDYSSLAFDVAYLKKPVIYYQEDKDEFFSGKHTYTPGYFNFERDGFGEVALDGKELLKYVENCLCSNCEMNDKYIVRTGNTFEYVDKKNCERVWEATKVIIGE